jgi:cardiolipin synthase
MRLRRRRKSSSRVVFRSGNRGTANLRAITFAAIAVVLGGLVGCADVPDVAPLVDRASAGGEAPHIVGSRGPLTARQSRAILARLAATPGEAGLLQRHTAEEQAVAETPLIAGNRTRVLRDGAETFAAMFAAMRAAKSTINLEYYILEDIDSDGAKLSDLLVAKRAEGVAVHVLYDSYGSSATPAAFFERLKDAGVVLLEFNPLDPLAARSGYKPNDRDHRKILLVDGATAIVGGINLSKTYEAHPLAKSGAPEGRESKPWRDTDLEIDGPAAREIQSLFVAHWRAQEGPPLDTSAFFPDIAPKGAEVVRVIGSTPEHEIPRYYVTALTAIRNAEKSIALTAAYFVPTAQEMEDLEQAAARGVDVRLLLPDRTDSALATDVQHSRYEDLMEAGVKIYETHDVVLHAKTLTVDGVWSVVGSSNFDHRSVLFNDEVDVVVLGSETAAALRRMFEDDLSKARRIDPAAWADRALGERIEEYAARLWQSVL